MASSGRPKGPDQPRGFVRVYIDLYPETSDALNELARQRGVSKKNLIHEIVTTHLGKEKPHGKK